MKQAALLAVLLVLGPSSALGDEPMARAHYASGRSYYDQGRYEDALREFEEAFRAAPDAQKGLMIFNVGQALERLGRLEQAASAFQQYLELVPDAEDRATVTERIRILRERLTETSIVLTSSEAGARVFVDGQESGTTPLASAIRVSPGSHELRVEKDGFRPVRLRVSVDAGRRVETDVTLVAVERAPARGREVRSGPGVLPWIFAGVAGVAVAGGSVLGVMALGESDAANEQVEADADLYDEHLSDAETLALFADIAFGAAVAAAAVSVVLLVTGGASDEPGPASDVALRTSPMALHDGAGLVVEGAF